MNIKARIQAMWKRREVSAEDLPGSIPSAWLEPDPLTGAFVGPPPGYEMPDNQRETWELVNAMHASVPHCPTEEERPYHPPESTSRVTLHDDQMLPPLNET